MDPIILMIAKSARTLLLKGGKEGVRRLLTEPLLQRAATATQLEFERIEIRDTLVKWSQSEDLVELLEDLKDGKRHDVGSLVPAFLENTEFSAGEETERTAQVVIEAFLKNVVDEMIRSPKGLGFVADRQEILHGETKSHVTIEADRIIEHLDLTRSGRDRTPFEDGVGPLQQLMISDFAGVRGEATITFGSLTLFRGTMKLSHTMCELLRIFSDRQQFERTCQPTDGSSSEYGRVPLTDERELVITVNHPHRTFTKRGTLRLLHFDGQEFIVTIQKSGATLSLRDRPVPVFTPVIKAISPGKFSASYSDLEQGLIEKKLSSHLGISIEELKACVEGVPTDTSVFRYDYSFEHTLKVRRPSEPEFQTVPSLSGGEQSRLLLDLAVRISTYRANVEPTILLVDQAKVFMDPQGWACFLEWLENKMPPFQTVIDLHIAPSRGNLAHAICYEVTGEDMEVSAFESKPWELFKR